MAQVAVEQDRARMRTGLSTSLTRSGTIDFRIRHEEGSEDEELVCIIVDGHNWIDHLLSKRRSIERRSGRM